MNAPPTNPDLTARGLAHERDFALGGMTVRPSLCRAEINGEARHLEPRVALVLLALGKSEGSVLSRDDLIAWCWDGVVVGDDAINRVIGKIRRLAECPDAGFLIETVPRVGYRLVRADDQASRDANEGQTVRMDAGDEARRPEAMSDRRVAVLPFDGEGGPDAASLAEGATDCILSSLARDGGLSVVGRPDSSRFRGQRKRNAARALGATQLVDGAVSISGDEMRITAYLIDGTCGLMLWSEQFRGTTADPFALQQLSAVRVTEALRRNHAL